MLESLDDFGLTEFVMVSPLMFRALQAAIAGRRVHERYKET